MLKEDKAGDKQTLNLKKSLLAGNKSVSSLMMASKENLNPNIGKRSASILFEGGEPQPSAIVRKPAFAKVVDINCSYLD